MRERSTWNRNDVVKKAADLKKADIYTMNQDHPQPAADKYVTGDPSTFAEDVHTPNTWESEYKGDEVKRNEIGMPEMRSDTFNHSEKTASKEVLLKKADLCVAVARIMLAGTKTASEKSIENQAFSLMFMPDQALIATHKRLAGEQQDEGADEDADEGQEKQAQQDQEEEQAQAKQAQDQEQDEDKDQAKQAQDQQDQDQGQGQEKQAAIKTLVGRVAHSLKTGNFKRAQEQMQQLVQQQQAQGQQQQVSQQQMQAQIQQMIQEAMGQQVPQQAPAQQAQQQQAPMQQQSDEQTLDQMLAQDGCGPMAESDIQMDPAPMDVGMDDLGPEDEALRTLFAQDDEQEVQQQTQQKQAGVRTASTRTVGTRPTAGVAKLGGGSQGGGASVSDLSSLWQSAPDVRDAFGLK